MFTDYVWIDTHQVGSAPADEDEPETELDITVSQISSSPSSSF